MDLPSISLKDMQLLFM